MILLREEWALDKSHSRGIWLKRIVLMTERRRWKSWRKWHRLHAYCRKCIFNFTQNWCSIDFFRLIWLCFVRKIEKTIVIIKKRCYRSAWRFRGSRCGIDWIRQACSKCLQQPCVTKFKIIMPTCMVRNEFVAQKWWIVHGVRRSDFVFDVQNFKLQN